MKNRVFIDGASGTVGLQIYDRLRSRRDIELLTIEDDKKFDEAARKAMINSADIVFLCLPDDVARRAVELIENENTRVIDASTAHRTSWTYGFPELSGQLRSEIVSSKRVANPGCHASGAISIIYPLRQLGLIGAEENLCIFSITGYSGGGINMIEQYEAGDRSMQFASPRLYSLGQSHKHIPEIMKVCGLEKQPVFCPIVADYYCGMATTLTLHAGQLVGRPRVERIREIFREYYSESRFIDVSNGAHDPLAANLLWGTNNMVICVNGSGECITITSVFDNLGKGASGAAVQNMNLMLSLPEEAGLI